MRVILLFFLLFGLPSCALFSRADDGPLMGVNEDALESAAMVVDALEGDDDGLAWRLLERMRAFHHDPETLLWIAAVERVLEGRQLLASIDLSLVVRVEEVDGARVRSLVLRADAHGQQDLELFMAPPTLRCRRSWIDLGGEGGTSDDSVALDWVESLVLPGQQSAEFPIMRLETGRGGAVAIREHWEMEMRFCSLVQAERSFPVNAPRVKPVDRSLIATPLALGELDAGPLLEVLLADETPPIQQLVERAVRIPEAHKAHAMDAIMPRLAELSARRIELAASVLAWIAAGADLDYYEPGNAFHMLGRGGVEDLPILSAKQQLLDPLYLRANGHAWKRWAAAWIELRARKPQSTLDLPGAVSEAPAPAPETSQP